MSVETKYVLTCNVCGTKEEDHIKYKADGWSKIYYKVTPLGDAYSGAITKEFDVCKNCSIHYNIIERDGAIKSIINWIKGTK